MTHYDFVVTRREKTPITGLLKAYVEKVAVLDDDLTLDDFLRAQGVEDKDVGAVIESLEAIPYGAKRAHAFGRNGRILIEQIN